MFSVSHICVSQDLIPISPTISSQHLADFVSQCSLQLSLLADHLYFTLIFKITSTSSAPTKKKMLLYIINSILRFSFRVNIICKLSENSEELASQFVRAGSMDIYHFVLNDENENLTNAVH